MMYEARMRKDVKPLRSVQLTVDELEEFIKAVSKVDIKYIKNVD